MRFTHVRMFALAVMTGIAAVTVGAISGACELSDAMRTILAIIAGLQGYVALGIARYSGTLYERNE